VVFSHERRFHTGLSLGVTREQICTLQSLPLCVDGRKHYIQNQSKTLIQSKPSTIKRKHSKHKQSAIPNVLNHYTPTQCNTSLQSEPLTSKAKLWKQEQSAILNFPNLEQTKETYRPMDNLQAIYYPKSAETSVFADGCCQSTFQSLPGE
jgi:hypothetical protein